MKTQLFQTSKLFGAVRALLLGLALGGFVSSALANEAENALAAPHGSGSAVIARALESSLEKNAAIQKQADIAAREKSLRTLVTDNPESVSANAQLAAFLLSQNQTREAIGFYQDAISLKPDEPALFAMLSVAYLHQSQYGMARAMADEALRLRPDMPQASKLLEYIQTKRDVLEMASEADQTLHADQEMALPAETPEPGH